MFSPPSKLNNRILLLMECLFIIGTVHAAQSDIVQSAATGNQDLITLLYADSETTINAAASSPVSGVISETETSTVSGSGTTVPSVESTTENNALTDAESTPVETKHCSTCEMLYSKTAKETSNEQEEMTTGTNNNPTNSSQSSRASETSMESSTDASPSTKTEGKVYKTIYDYFLDNPPQTRHQKKLFEIQKGLGEQFRLKWTPDWNKSRVVKLTPKTSWSHTWIDVFSGEEWSYETAERIRYGWDCFVCTFIISVLSFFLLWGWDYRHRAFVVECRQRGTKPMWTRWEDYDLTPIFSWPFGRSDDQEKSG